DNGVGRAFPSDHFVQGPGEVHDGAAPARRGAMAGRVERDRPEAVSEQGRDEAGELATHAGPPVEEIDGRAAAPRPARNPLAVDDHVEPPSFGERRARAPRAAAAPGR